MIRICVSGSKGKMGSRIAELSRDDASLELSGSFDAGDESQDLIEACDCLIEFTTTEATVKNLQLCEKLGKAIVIGTTGLSASEQEMVREAAKKIPVIFSPNMSVGVNLLFKMIADAARVLGDGYDVSIVEAHHIHKKDAPSGTAKEMARIVKDVSKNIEVPIESVREDEIVGEHTITFDSPTDLVEITHSAKTRDIFANGALKAAKFIVGKPAGLYSMKDVLGL
ncbi:MAG: 4-hydroxy-tetrahydrodipicolinate reductase [Candidatus Omnitrophica bacterium]|nr:4-hydroxy-tetrahydrodipicolinate reductase [Candidatus Omnitrophota bacterium]MBU1808411.1 4-hydroxy-tetrahydrodipicolinate reductase [Candidatus Omnitrophota bacterium]